MKTTCHREALLSACQLASAAIPARATKPVLQNLKAVADDGRFTLMATDLEQGIRMEVRGLTIQEPGEAILPAQRLIAILREARDAELTIEADATACIVRGVQLEFEMPSEDPANFPDLPTFTEEKYHEVAAADLREMIKRHPVRRGRRDRPSVDDRSALGVGRRSGPPGRHRWPPFGPGGGTRQVGRRSHHRGLYPRSANQGHELAGTQSARR